MIFIIIVDLSEFALCGNPRKLLTRLGEALFASRSGCIFQIFSQPISIGNMQTLVVFKDG